jgi:hypothetical protein
MSQKMDIILAEYQKLREEIITKMEACWKILTFETGGTSIVLGFVFANGQYMLLPIIPFLILISSFLHLGETSAIINAGDYIRDRIEPDLKKVLDEDFKSMSWEAFVKERHRPYKWSPYKWIHMSTFSLFAGMFWASIILTILLKGRIGISLTSDLLLYLLSLGYSVAFVVYVYAWRAHIWKKLG